MSVRPYVSPVDRQQQRCETGLLLSAGAGSCGRRVPDIDDRYLLQAPALSSKCG